VSEKLSPKLFANERPVGINNNDNNNNKVK
jgi:hypothetical protein